MSWKDRLLIRIMSNKLVIKMLSNPTVLKVLMRLKRDKGVPD